MTSLLFWPTRLQPDAAQHGSNLARTTMTCETAKVRYYQSIIFTVEELPMGRLLVTGITFGVFMAEALVHYNMGVAKAGRQIPTAAATPP